MTDATDLVNDDMPDGDGPVDPRGPLEPPYQQRAVAAVSRDLDVALERVQRLEKKLELQTLRYDEQRRDCLRQLDEANKKLEQIAALTSLCDMAVIEEVDGD